MAGTELRSKCNHFRKDLSHIKNTQSSFYQWNHQRKRGIQQHN